jgi:hypothetical protein
MLFINLKLPRLASAVNPWYDNPKDTFQTRKPAVIKRQLSTTAMHYSRNLHFQQAIDDLQREPEHQVWRWHCFMREVLLLVLLALLVRACMS